MLARLFTLAAAGLLLAPPRPASAAPSLPFPAAPPTACEGLAGQLVAGLYAADEQIGPFVVDVTFDAQGKARDAAPLTTHVTLSLEAALRARVAAAGPRLAPGAEGVTEQIDVRLVLADGHLAGTAARTHLPSNIWQRLAAPGGQVVKTAFSTWAVDLEVRTLLGLDRTAARLDALRVVPVTERTVALDPEPILDLTVADLDGDWLPELVLLQARTVRVLAWRDGAFTVDHARFDLGVLPPNTARLRAPLGRLVVVTRPDGARLLIAASSDRAEPALLTLEPGGGLVPVTAAGLDTGWPLYATTLDSWVVCDWPHGVDTLGGAAREVSLGGQGATRLAAIDGAYDVRAFPLRLNASPTWNPALTRTAAGGQLELWTAATQPTVLSRQGTVAVVVDLDGDGVVELLTTSDAVDGRDRLTLSHLRADHRAPRRLWSGEVRAPVTAAASGDVDRDGYREFVVATWNGRAPSLLIVVPRT